MFDRSFTHVENLNVLFVSIWENEISPSDLVGRAREARGERCPGLLYRTIAQEALQYGTYKVLFSNQEYKMGDELREGSGNLTEC